MFEHELSARSVSASLTQDLLSRLAGESPQLRKLGVGLPCPWDGDPDAWLTHLFPEAVTAPFAPHHRELWAWAWSLRRGVRPRPFVAIWPRGGAKSSTAELVTIATGALGLRRYALYVSATQDLADKHVADIARRLESDAVARYYPALGAREVSKYGISRGWQGSRLRTAAGFMVDAIGLNAAVRGLKAGDARPDTIIVDDIDELADSPVMVEAKIRTLTQSIFPAGSTDLAVLAVQNLIWSDSIFSRLAGRSEQTVDFLADRIVSGPFPAVLDLEITRENGRAVITRGTALWQGQSLAACQDAIDTFGERAFRRESQHEVEDQEGGLFAHVEFRRCDPDEVPDLVRVVGAVDPAVTDTDASDAHGVQIDGISADGTLYRLFSWEQRASPERALSLALARSVQFGAESLTVETNQGGDLWETHYRALVARLVSPDGLTVDGATYHLPPGRRPPTFKSARASVATGSKADRASQMLLWYEQGRIVHVRGTHGALERGLKRFLAVKPFDLVDCAYWSWRELAGTVPRRPVSPVSITAPSPWGSMR